MHNVSEKLKEKFRNFGSTKDMFIFTMTDSEHTVFLDMNTIAMNTVSFEQILEPSDNLTFTGCNASVLKFRAKDDVTYLEGRPIAMGIGANISDTEEEDYEYVYLFNGIVDSVKNTTSMQMSMDVVAYDFMKIINELDVTVWYNTLPFNLSSSGTLPLSAIKGSLFSEIYNRIKTKYDVNIQFYNYDMPNDSVYIPKNIDDKNIYAGDILKFICQINGRYAQMRGYTCVFIDFEKEGLYPSELLYPNYDLYPSGVTSDEDISNASYKLGTLQIEKYTTAPIDGVRLINKDNQEIAYEGAAAPLNIFTVSGNPLIYGLEQEALDEIAENLYEEIDGVVYIPMTLDMIGLPYLECGDYINVQVNEDIKSTYILHRVLSGEHALTDHIETKGDEYLPIFKPNTDDKIREAISKAKNETRQMITEYDIAVQIMNDLAVNAIGGYQDYEEAESGGRIYYLSNRPITKNAQGACVFEIGSTVFMSSGDGLYVSLDGGTTWINGYNATTGRLVVNVLNAIGISADWIKTGKMIADRIRGGTLLIGGVNNAEGRILACTTNSEEVIEDIFDGVSHDIYVFGEGSNLPYVSGTNYATCDLYHFMTQPVYYNEYLDSQTPLAYFRGIIGGNTDDWQENRAYVTEHTQPVYGVTYYKGSSISLLLLSTASFKGKIKTTMSPSRGSTETESTFISSSVQPSQTYPFPSTVYFYNVTDTSRGLDSDHIDPEPSTTSASVTGNTMRLELSYIVLFGEHHSDSNYDLDWYYQNDNYPGSYIPAGTHVYYVTDTLTAKTENDEHTYECFLQPNCYAVVIQDKNTGMLQHLFMCLGTQSYYTRKIDGGAPEIWNFNKSISNFIGDQTLWYTRLGGMYSSTLSVTDANFVYTDDSQFPEIVRQIGIVIYSGVKHAPNVIFLPPKSFSFGIDVSNISDAERFEGLYQIFETEDAGENFTQIDESYLIEGENFIDTIFNIPSDLKDLRYYKLLLGRSSTTFDATYDYIINKYEFTTEIDNNGIRTTNGTFGILKIDNTDPTDTKIIIAKDSNILYEEDYTDYNKLIRGSFRFSPYQLIWTQDATLAVDFSSTVTYGATENRYSCKVKLVKVDANNATSHTINTFALNSKGKIFSGVHAGEDPVFSELIDHEWGKNQGEYYIFGYTIYKRSFSTGDNAHIKLFDADNNAQVGTVISKNNIVSNFIGNFSGQANFNVLQVGDWSFDYANQKMIIDAEDDTSTDYDGTEIGRDRVRFKYGDDYSVFNKDYVVFHNSDGDSSIRSEDTSNNIIWRLQKNLLQLVGNNYIADIQSNYARFRLRDDSFSNSVVSIGANYDGFYDGLYQLESSSSYNTDNYMEHHSNLDNEKLELYYMYHTDEYLPYNEYIYNLDITFDDITKRERISGTGVDITYGLTWTTSDERVKEDIENLDVMLSKQLIDRTQPKKFKYKGTDGKHYGMIAQDARKVLDELGEEDAKLEHSMNIPKERAVIDDQRTIDYQEYIPHLINYVKELKAEIDSLKAEIKTLKGE